MQFFRFSLVAMSTILVIQTIKYYIIYFFYFKGKMVKKIMTKNRNWTFEINLPYEKMGQ